MMNESDFWTIIDRSRQQAQQMQRRPGEDFLSVHERTLADALGQIPPADIIAFSDRFWEYHQLAYRWDLWAAAYWLHGGCGNDGFIDFRSCLISLGKQLYFQVLHDPDSLVDLVDRPDVPYMQAEGFQYIASQTYKAKTGQDMPLAAVASHERPEPAGKRIDHDDDEVMRQHFPKLVAKFPDMGD
jgi:hypothetical protein